jgi:hypothetical protein
MYRCVVQGIFCHVDLFLCGSHCVVSLEIVEKQGWGRLPKHSHLTKSMIVGELISSKHLCCITAQVKDAFQVWFEDSMGIFVQQADHVSIIGPPLPLTQEHDIVHA